MGSKRGARILIVDDHQDNVELLQARLAVRVDETVSTGRGRASASRLRAPATSTRVLSAASPRSALVTAITWSHWAGLMS